MFTLASAGTYVSELLRAKKYGIGMRSRTEDKEKESACALKKKRRNWHVRSAEEKEQELDEWRAEDKEYGLVCACTVPKTKSTDWYTFVRR